MDLETCSLCLEEVEDSTLIEVSLPNPLIYEGARACPICYSELCEVADSQMGG